MSDADSPDDSLAARIEAQKQALDDAHARIAARLNALSEAVSGEITAPPPPERDLRMEEDNEALRADLQDARARIAVLEEELATAEAERNQLARDLKQAAIAAHTPVSPAAPAPYDPKAGITAHDQHGHKRRMGDILVDAGVISEAQLDAAISEKAVRPHQRLGEILVGMGLTSEEVIATILAAQLRLPFVNLKDLEIDARTTARLSVNLARRHRAIVIQADAAKITVAMANPLDLIAIEDIELATRSRVEPVVATPSAIRAATKRAYGIP